MTWRYGFTGFVGLAAIAATLLFGEAGSAVFALFARHVDLQQDRQRLRSKARETLRQFDAVHRMHVIE